MTRLFTTAILLAAFALPGVASAGDITAGNEKFQALCVSCHGPGGKGDGPNVTEDFKVSPRNFTNAKEMNKLSDADLKNVILDGGPAVDKSPLMPPWGKTLSVEHFRTDIMYYIIKQRISPRITH